MAYTGTLHPQVNLCYMKKTNWLREIFDSLEYRDLFQGLLVQTPRGNPNDQQTRRAKISFLVYIQMQNLDRTQVCMSGMYMTSSPT